MCPACIATAVWIAGSAASGGGLTAFLARKFHLKKLGAKKFCVKKIAHESYQHNHSKENYDGNQHDRGTALESSFAGRVG
jgi:hypothetical protein